MSIPTFQVTKEVAMPAIGYGVGTRWFKKGGVEDKPNLNDALETAYDKGFRFFDGAEVYATEENLGTLIKQHSREDLFVLTKLVPGAGTNVSEHFEESLKKLGVDYVDQYLLHAPFDADFVTQWQEVEKFYESGKAKSIGVSNFRVQDLEELLKVAKVPPATNEIEYNPYLPQSSIVDYCKAKGIQVLAYSPLGPLVYVPEGEGPLRPLLKTLEDKYKKTSGQILLRWTYDTGVLPITTSSKPERVAEYLDSFSFELDSADREAITQTGATYPFRKYWTNKDWS